MDLKFTPTPSFKLISEALGLTVQETAALFSIPHSTAVSYSSGKRKTPEAVLEQGREFMRTIDHVASCFIMNPQAIHYAPIDRRFLRAVERRILEMNAVDRRILPQTRIRRPSKKEGES